MRNSIGLIVDAVLEVVDIPATEIDDPSLFKKTKDHEDYIIGIGKVEENIKIFIDAGKIILREDLNKIKTE